MIQFKNVHFEYDKNAPILHGVSFEVPDGSFTVVVGRSGAGKSTILKLIAGLIKPTAGNVIKDGTVAMVFQNGALLPWLTISRNVSLPLEVAGATALRAKTKTHESLMHVELAEFKDRYPRELSGGQRQRAGIARALAIEPSILLLDEPFSALDAKTAQELRDDLLRIWQMRKITMIMVSHSVEEAVTLAQHAYILKPEGTITKIEIDLPYPRSLDDSATLAKAMHIRKLL